ncbi:hypothetical protein JTE90_022007 [Oedothorax gibbosus]|uniref:Uncharacterized protein n=1 Tax=Oedothorax gibbosus TaxID=931172 RepID=A0AAV6V0W9_9ARAC|nr:hypothetical protein JTE90_022007 [Oedothorax gibbosus]
MKQNQSITKERIYVGPSLRKNSQLNQALCVCGSRKCHHKGHIHDSDLSLTKLEDNHIPILPDITQSVHHVHKPTFHAKSTRSKSWDRLDDKRKTDSTFGTTDLEKDLKTSNSLPSLTNPFPRRVPAALLAAINERLGPDVHPEDTIVVEMSSAGHSSSKMRHAFTVQELQEVVSRYEEQVGRKVKPIPLESVLDADDDGPITFEIRHGRERNIFKLPAAKLKNNKKWQVTFTIGKNQKSLLAK